MSSLQPTLCTLLIKTKDDSTFKRLKRKLCRAPDLDIKSVTPKTDIEQILIHKIKSNAGKKLGKWLHVLHDRQTLLHLLHASSEPMCNLPPSWDILCFSSEIESYDYDCPQNSIYWCKAKVKSSVNFLLNPKSFAKCIGVLKQSGAGLSNLFANVNTFVVTQYAYSDPTDSNESSTNSIKCIDRELIACDTPSGNVTFITVVTDPTAKNAASHCVLTFLRSNLSHNTELIIVDGCDFDKTVDVSGDSRIKVVKIKSKDNEVIPLGYSLNIAVKHASYDVIFHLLPQNFYFSQNLNKLVHCFAGHGFDMLLSADSCLHNPDQKTSFLRKTPSIANCIYLKNFWNVNHFIELENDEIKLLHHFTKGRMSLVQCFPSILCSFTHNQSTISEKDTAIMSLPDLLSNETKELYETLLK